MSLEELKKKKERQQKPILRIFWASNNLVQNVQALHHATISWNDFILW